MGFTLNHDETRHYKTNAFDPCRYVPHPTMTDRDNIRSEAEEAIKTAEQSLTHTSAPDCEISRDDLYEKSEALGTLVDGIDNYISDLRTEQDKLRKGISDIEESIRNVRKRQREDEQLKKKCDRLAKLCNSRFWGLTKGRITLNQDAA